MNTRVARYLSASKSGRSSALHEAWHLQWRVSALGIAAIEDTRAGVSSSDGRPQVLCATVARKPAKRWLSCLTCELRNGFAASTVSAF
jgi:hypothetical protein